MTTSGGGRGRELSRGAGELSRQLASETKPSVFTTEFWAYVLVAIAILIAGLVSDSLDATQVWLYITVLTAAYILSRGIARGGTQREQTGLEGGGSPMGRRGRRASSQETRGGSSIEVPFGERGAVPPAAEGEGRPGSRGPGL
jgi:hypothetical protein